MDINDPSKARRSKKRQARLDAIRRDDVAYVMADERGRRFMYELMFHQLGLQDVYEGNDSGVHRHEGRRSAAVKLGVELQADQTEAYILMITERMEFVRQGKALRDAAEDETPETGEAPDAT